MLHCHNNKDPFAKSVDSKELKITGGGMHGIRETRMGAELDKRRILRHCQPKVWSDAPIIEEYESDSEDECVSIPTKQQETPSFANQQVKTPRENVKSQNTHSQKPKVDKKDLGHGCAVRACFVCGSLNHLIRDCDFHEKRMARKADLNNSWNNVQRMNKQNQFVPSAVLTRTGIIPVSTARASIIQQNQANLHAGQQEANQNAGKEEIIDAGDSDKEDDSTQDCFVLPIWPSYSSPNLRNNNR
ncbi:hypothetical protein Tco_1300620 [Tanacetum coccineum]